MLALFILAALLTAGPAWRRALGLVVAVAAMLAPLAVPGPPLLRGTLALLGFWGAARVLDLARETREFSPGRRVFHVLALIDTRQLRFVRPRFDRRALAFAAAATWAAWHVLDLAGRTPPPLRWLLGVAFLYFAAEALSHALRLVLRAAGAEAPPLHRTPIAARSLREFWGERWNLVVSRWLRAHCYMPLARRRRPVLGLALAFVASAALHAWSVGVALGPAAAASMGGYFLIQGVLLALEHRLDIDRWPAPAGRAWMLAGTLLPSPLFIEPLLRVFEGR